VSVVERAEIGVPTGDLTGSGCLTVTAAPILQRSRSIRIPVSATVCFRKSMNDAAYAVNAPTGGERPTTGGSWWYNESGAK